MAQLASFAPDIILSDYSMPNFAGSDALALARTHAPEIPFIFLSGTIGEEIAIESLRSGAVDYILKNNMGVSRPPSSARCGTAASVGKSATPSASCSRSRSASRFSCSICPDRRSSRISSGRLQFVNRAFEKMANLTSQELIWAHEPRDLAAVGGDL